MGSLIAQYIDIYAWFYFLPHILIGLYVLKRIYSRYFNRRCGNVRAWSDFPIPEGNPGFRYPFTPFPTGWYFVAMSKDIKAGGKAHPLKICGKDLVIYRGENGKVHVMDAFCAHLGAHLGHGGRVEGNCVRCPMHSWKYDGETGKCVNIPYSDQKIPEAARIQTHKVREINELIFILHSLDGSEPDIELPELEAVKDPSYTLVHMQWKKIRVHIQEIVENAVDIAHFDTVHFYDTLPDVQDFKMNGGSFYVYVTSKRTVLTWQDTAHMHLTYHGLGMVLSTVDSPQVQARVILTITPIDEEHVETNIFLRYQRTWNIPKNIFFWWYLQYHVGNDFWCDQPIWQHKMYRTNPLLVKGDGPVGAIRRWAKQFYHHKKTSIEIADSDEGNESGEVSN